ncbi:recombinase family protein [Lacrimispora celerecrescens]|uniref:recombinase family protein n=1 Tax=Lacrimispora celerecrescens TaxID=29354 RepID=UPI001FCB4851|nr:recombinase family protein [Lacrimispora celerecrescens]
MSQSVRKLRAAAYCRVSTAQEEQLLSYENQVNYYTKFINENPLYEYAGTYADEGISATNTKKRDEFKRMIADCRVGKIDMIITKSISRFARNTLDCLNYVRELKELGIGIIFEKENINTLDAKGEVLLTILSSLAQDESRSISENSTWGIRRRFEKGQHKMSTKRFLGYDTDEDGKLVVNRKQAQIVARLYSEFLNGKTVDYIKRIFEREGVKNWDGETKWQTTTLQSMLENEKYKGDAILQKSYTTDFLTKKRVQNNGELQKFHIEDDHEAIIEPWIWECVQLEVQRRKEYLEEHGTNSYSHRPETNPFASKIVCGCCNKVFARKGWRSSTGVARKVWQCCERYKVKGVMGCANRHVEESTLEKAFVMAWNAVFENKEYFWRKWERQKQSENFLEVYRAKDFQELTKDKKLIEKMDADFILRILNHIKVFEDGMLMVVFLDGSEIECKNEEE